MALSFDPDSKHSAAGILILLLLAIFTTELAVMELIGLLIPSLGWFSASVADATILVLLVAGPLWAFVVQPLRSADATSVTTSGGTAGRVYLYTLAGIFLVEFLVNFALLELIPEGSYKIQSLLDASLTIVFCTPILWWLLHRLDLHRRQVSLWAQLRGPLRLYLLVLWTIFLIDLLEEQLQNFVSIDVSPLSFKIVDAFCSTILIAPLLWMLVASPLKRVAQSAASRVSTLYTQLSDAIVIIDSHGSIKFINPAAERIFCCRADELVGRPLARLVNDNQEFLDGVSRVAGNGSQENHHLFSVSFLNRLDGSTLFMDVTISKVMLEGQEEFLLLMRDLTARTLMQSALRESEERFRQIFDQSEDAIIFFSPDTCAVLGANSTSERLFGSSREEMQRDGWGCLGQWSGSERLLIAICDIRKGGTAQREDVVMTRSDGAEMFVSMRGKIMTLLGEEVIYCTFRDTTERVRLRREAREIQAKLIQTNKMTSLGLLVSGVAHEINNPNNFIMVNSQLLAQTWPDTLTILREYAQTHGDYALGNIPFSVLDRQSPDLIMGIIEGSRRIDEIIKNLKTFARQDRLALEEAVDVNWVATAAVSILHHEINRYTRNFHLDLAEGIPGIRGNRQQLGQVVINLLMNACQALPSREGGVWLSTGFDANASRVAITVRDEGCGISPDVRARIMEPFFTTKRDAGGTGLGLSISRSIVKDHCGTLEFLSEEGQGTTVVVHIPVGEPAGQELFR